MDSAVIKIKVVKNMKENQVANGSMLTKMLALVD